jgi:hypothetical protein
MLLSEAMRSNMPVLLTLWAKCPQTGAVHVIEKNKRCGSVEDALNYRRSGVFCALHAASIRTIDKKHVILSLEAGCEPAEELLAAG